MGGGRICGETVAADDEQCSPAVAAARGSGHRWWWRRDESGWLWMGVGGWVRGR